MMNGQGTPPSQLSVESGGATSSGHLQWIQSELNRHTQELGSTKSSIESIRDSVGLLTAAELERKVHSASAAKDITFITEKITEIKGSQVTLQVMEQIHARFLEKQHVQHVQFLEKLHEAQLVFTESISSTKAEARDALISYSKEVDKKQTENKRWLIGLCMAFGIAVIGLVAAYLRSGAQIVS